MFWVMRSDGNYVTFDGMAESDVTSMLAVQGLSGVFIARDAYAKAVQSLPVPVESTPPLPSVADQLAAIWNWISANPGVMPLETSTVLTQLTNAGTVASSPSQGSSI